MIQETHWVQDVYNDIKDNWNVNVILTGNSRIRKGLAIVLNKSLEYTIHNPKIDGNGRYILLDIDIMFIGKITLGSLYAPIDKIEEFVEEEMVEYELQDLLRSENASKR